MAERPFRICITGAECTGKTTLARVLGERLGAPVVFEGVRDYFEHKALRGDPSVFAGDIVQVTKMQMETEDSAPREVPVVLYDTDLFTIWVWHERYIGRQFQDLTELVAQRQAGEQRMDLYVLTAPDIPFEHDLVRGSGADREHMHGEFLRQLVATDRRFVEVRGTVAERCRRAELEVEHAMAERELLG